MKVFKIIAGIKTRIIWLESCKYLSLITFLNKSLSNLLWENWIYFVDSVSQSVVKYRNVLNFFLLMLLKNWSLEILQWQKNTWKILLSNSQILIEWFSSLPDIHYQSFYSIINAKRAQNEFHWCHQIKFGEIRVSDDLDDNEKTTVWGIINIIHNYCEYLI